MDSGTTTASARERCAADLNFLGDGGKLFVSGIEPESTPSRRRILGRAGGPAGPTGTNGL